MNIGDFAQITGSFLVVLIILIIAIIGFGYLFGPEYALLAANVSVITAGTYLALAINSTINEKNDMMVFT